jgi:putative MATE family efflux protein
LLYSTKSKKVGLMTTHLDESSASQTNAKVLRLVRGPIAATLLALAIPGTLASIVFMLMQLGEIYCVARLGTAPLAAVTVVFPAVVFMQLVSAGDFAGAIGGATARAMGAGRLEEANIILFHSFAFALAGGLIFSVFGLSFGETLYRTLGGTDTVLADALIYGNMVFGGAGIVWAANMFAACVRGTGDIHTPALIQTVAAIVALPVCFVVTLGWGPVSSFGIAGAAVGYLAYYAISLIGLLYYLNSERTPLRLSFDLRQLDVRIAGELSRVGGISALRTIQTTLASLLLVRLVGNLGDAAIAGYGIASRLEALLVPFLFGLGVAIRSMVGASVGAADMNRAHKVALHGVGMSIIVSGLVGAIAAYYPGLWLDLFSKDPLVLGEAEVYLRIAAPFYGLFGGGAVAYFVGQALGRMRWAFAAASGRLLIVFFSQFLLDTSTNIGAIAAVVATSYVAFGIINFVVLMPSFWDKLSTAK